jgi:hypothetical protein
MDPLVSSRDAGVDPAIVAYLDRARRMTAGEVVDAARALRAPWEAVA